MIECPICHNVENQVVPYCSKCGHHLVDNCNYCNRTFNNVSKPQKNKIDYYSILFLKIIIILIFTGGIINYFINSTDIDKYSPISYITRTTQSFGNILDRWFGFTGSHINISDKHKTNNNTNLKKQNLIFLSNKYIQVNDIKTFINLFYTKDTNKAQITLDVRSKIKEIEFIDNADIYVIYLFKNPIAITDININELDINPNLIAKFIYMKNINNKTIINEKEYEFLSDNLFIKWMK